MLPDQVKARLTEAVGVAAAVTRGSPTARVAPMLLLALSADDLASATGTPPGAVSDLVAQTTAIQQHPGAEAVRLLHPAILRILAEGRLASPEELAARTGRSADDVARLLGHAVVFPGAELDADGRVLGAGRRQRP